MCVCACLFVCVKALKPVIRSVIKSRISVREGEGVIFRSILKHFARRQCLGALSRQIIKFYCL